MSVQSRLDAHGTPTGRLVVALPAVSAAEKVSVRAAVGTSLWLKWVQLATKRRALMWAFLGWCAYVMAVAVFAQVAYVTEVILPSDALNVLVPLWLLWAFLPVFGGGGELEQARYLDAYPLPRPFLVAGSVVAALIDVQYVVLGPIVLGMSWAAWGPMGVAASLVFLAGAALTGQVAAWAVTAAGERAWRVVAGAIAVLAVVGWAVSAHPGWLPPAHLAGFMEAWQYDPPGKVVVQGVLLSLPLWLFAAAIGPLSTSTLRNRGETPAKTPRLVGTYGWGLASAHMYSIWRSMTAKVTVVSCFIVPFVMKVAYPDTSVEQVLAVTLLAGGAAVATNTYSYDHTGTLALLGMPLSKLRLAVMRLATTLTWIVILCAPSLLMCRVLNVSARSDAAEAFGSGVLLALAVTVAGLTPTVRRPMEADHSSLRVRPAPPASTMGYMFRSGVFMGLILSVSDGVLPFWPVAAVVVGYTLWALRRAWLGLSDGAALTAAFKV